jgi:hypothetical protein
MIKASLKKNGGKYELVIIDAPIHIDFTNHTISFKNCQEIEFGYDLDELAEEEYKHLKIKHKYVSQEEENHMFFRNSIQAFKDGFQKRDELSDDKFFSKDDLAKYIREYSSLLLNSIKDKAHPTPDTLPLPEDFVDSISVGEWDVEIVMKNSRTGKIIKSESELEWDEDGLCDVAIPKLDESGKLILKRI